MRRVPRPAPAPDMPVGSEADHPLALPARLVILMFDIVGIVVAAPSGFGLFWFIPFAGVGTVLVFRRPRTSIGWLLLVLGWVHVLTTVTLDATVAQFSDGSLSLPMRFGGWLLGGAGGTLFLLYPVLMLTFPSGRLPRSRWGTLGRVAIGIGTGLALAAAFNPVINVNLTGYPNGVFVRNPFGIAPDAPIWQVLTADVAFFPLVVLMVASAISVVVRFGHAVGVERQQLRWMGASVIFVVIAVLGGLITSGLAPTLAESGVVWIPAIFAFPSIPISIGVAVMRYRLFEIDRIISRTISWAVTTGVIVAVFTGIVVGLQGLLAAVSGAGSNTLAVAASTLVVAALFQPIRRRVQRAADRRFNRARYDAQLTIDAFAERLRNEIDLNALRSTLVATADDAVRPVAATVWLRVASETTK